MATTTSKNMSYVEIAAALLDCMISANKLSGSRMAIMRAIGRNKIDPFTLKIQMLCEESIRLALAQETGEKPIRFMDHASIAFVSLFGHNWMTPDEDDKVHSSPDSLLKSIKSAVRSAKIHNL